MRVRVAVELMVLRFSEGEREGFMMFLCLAYGAEKDWKALPKDEQDALLAQDQKLRERGALMAAVELSTTTVTAWDGTPRVTIGTFGRSNVPLAGFSLIEADSADHAARLVADTPCARAKGAIEIRRVMIINDAEWKNRQPGKANEHHANE